MAGLSISTPEFIHFPLQPVIIIAVIGGIVVGKVSSTTVEGGFKHVKSLIPLIAICGSQARSLPEYTSYRKP